MAIFTNANGEEPSPPLPPQATTTPPRTVTFVDRITGKTKTVRVKQHPAIVERVGREPIDIRGCQMPSGRDATVPTRHRRMQCERAATGVMVENQKRGDGTIGGAAVCDECWKAIIATQGANYAKLTPLTLEAVMPRKADPPQT